MFTYTTKQKSQDACDRYNKRDHTKDWCGRPKKDDGKRAFPMKVPHGWSVKFK